MRRPLGLLAAAAALATIAAPVSTAQAGTASGAAEVGSAQENAVVRLVNARRAKKKGCPALKHHRQLHRTARGHSADMAEYGYFSSESRDDRPFIERLRKAGFKGGTRWAQNIAVGQRTPAQVVQSWMSSPGTKANIMDCKYTLIGVGAAEGSNGSIYWTQVLAAK